MLKVNELAKKAGEAWKNLSAEDRKPFVAKAEADKARYTEEVSVSLCKEGMTRQAPRTQQRWPASPLTRGTCKISDQTDTSRDTFSQSQ